MGGKVFFVGCPYLASLEVTELIGDVRVVEFLESAWEGGCKLLEGVVVAKEALLLIVVSGLGEVLGSGEACNEG